MHSRRLISMLVGAWLAAGILMDFVVIQNFRAVDRFLNAPAPAAAEQIRTLGSNGEARMFLRLEVGELNGFLFEQWEFAQLALGILLLLVIFFGKAGPVHWLGILAALMIAIVGIQRLYLTPEVTRLGRMMFSVYRFTTPAGVTHVPNNSGADAATFWRLHGIYSGVELLKLALAFGMSIILLTRSADRHRIAHDHTTHTHTHEPAPGVS